MHRCLIKTQELFADTLTLGRDEARHLQTVLRIKPGDAVALFDGHGHTRSAVVATADKHGLEFAPSGAPQTHPHAPCALTLFACVSKGKRMDWTKGVSI